LNGPAKPSKKSSLDWARSLIMFVIAWLIGLYVYEVAAGQYGPEVGIGLAILTLVVNGFARWRAMKSIRQADLGFYLWMAVPLILFFVVPFAVKLVTYLYSDDRQPWWRYVGTLLPFILKLGVPVLALFWVYVVLGNVRRRLSTETEPGVKAEPKPPADA
jgi:hypothetical protein